MDKDDAGFFGYDKAEKRRNTWCIPSFQALTTKSEPKKTSQIVQIIFEQCQISGVSATAVSHRKRRIISMFFEVMQRSVKPISLNSHETS